MKSEQQLLSAWRDGDEVAGEVLFERFYEGLESFFSSKVENEARDLIQRTFLILLERQESLPKGTNLRCYLFGIARNVLYEHYRKKKRDSRRFAPEQESVEDVVPTASALIVQAQESQLLLQALRRIPIESQLILELSFWEKMTAKEIGQVLDVPEGTARTRLRRAKQLLEAQMTAIAQSPGLLESTITDLERWAESLRSAVKQLG